MTTRLTLFTATLVQDSALSISGVDRESIADRPFTIVNNTPVLIGRGLKGAAVAMAQRFFDPLPYTVSEPASGKSLHRSAWEFSNTAPVGAVAPGLRAGVGILQKTGARASGVLYDLETVPAGTCWPLVFRVDWSWAGEEGAEAEGILGYVLSQHWKEGRCWLGGNVARGLGWCHIDGLSAYRLNEQDYEAWVTSGRQTLPQATLPQALADIPRVKPTRSWSFRTLEVKASFGEYRPNGDQEPAWGLDMLSVGTHDADRSVQPAASGIWARPSWKRDATGTESVVTDRSMAMEGRSPLLPGASVRGPMRHAFSRASRAVPSKERPIPVDPHLVQGNVDQDDPAGEIFGSVSQSSRLLICDAMARDGWAAARLHMHAEDEFSAGSYGSAKRDAVRLLRGEFPVRMVVEGRGIDEVEELTSEIDRLVALGACGHLPVGGHKTRGAGWGRWNGGEWQKCDVAKVRDWVSPLKSQQDSARKKTAQSQFPQAPEPKDAWAVIEDGAFNEPELTLESAAKEAEKQLSEAGKFVAWWCEPTIDLTVDRAPEVFGWTWPRAGQLRVDEVVFFAERGSWRAARMAKAVRWVMIREAGASDGKSVPIEVRSIPARLHGDGKRFDARLEAAGKSHLWVREWRTGVTVTGGLAPNSVIGFTLNKGDGR